jgi:enamine deaminase RidA (YjgF/YER057c/UK114 family)
VLSQNLGSRKVLNIARIGGNNRMSNVVRHENTLYLAGQVPDNVSVGITEQTREVLEKVSRILSENGSSKASILSCQIYLSDMRYFNDMNAVWDEWVAEGNAPARATVEARLASPAKFIEVCVVAAVEPQIP